MVFDRRSDRFWEQRTAWSGRLSSTLSGRLNLIDHADLSALRRDGERLAQFLEVPFWDGVHREGDSMTDLKREVLRRLTL